MQTTQARYPLERSGHPLRGRAVVRYRPREEESVSRAAETGCCVVGGGPGGMMLALLLARRGVRVTVLEARTDFERDFRGNTLNPAALEILEEVGLLDGLLGLPHAKVRRFDVQAAGEKRAFARFSRLKGARHPYILMLPQARFLEYLARGAERLPGFRLEMGARVRELVRVNGSVRGVRYRVKADGGDAQTREVRAGLVVGADGRFSTLRKLAGLEAGNTAAGKEPPMDVIWFDLPRRAGDPEGMGATFRCGRGALLVLMDHLDRWQVGYLIPKGDFRRLKDEGIDRFRRSVAELAPELRDRVGLLDGWRRVSLLSVEADRLKRWHVPGLLLLGDAAHVVSPVGGVGINLAIGDAAAAANTLAGPLLVDGLQDRHLEAVQRRRALDTRIVQAAQNLAQRWVVARALEGDPDEPFALPRSIRLALDVPLLRDVPARLIAYGLFPERVRGAGARLPGRLCYKPGHDRPGQARRGFGPRRSAGGIAVELFEAIRRRRTTNGPFLPHPVSREHQRALVDAAGMAPSHFNSQPWRFVLVDDKDKIEEISRISGESMTRVFEEGIFFRRYRPYFRFSEKEMEERRDGIFFDQLPKVLRPFTRQVFSDRALAVMNRLGIPKTLGEDNRKLVAGSPLLLAVLLDKAEYRPGELSGFYSVFGMGAAVENIWLATAALGMGIQFVSFPMEVPENWRKIQQIFEVPDDLELMAVYRLGYVPEEARRPTIDWSSRQRKRLSQYVFRNTCATPETDELGAESGASAEGSTGA